MRARCTSLRFRRSCLSFFFGPLGTYTSPFSSPLVSNSAAAMPRAFARSPSTLVSSPSSAAVLAGLPIALAPPRVVMPAESMSSARQFASASNSISARVINLFMLALHTGVTNWGSRASGAVSGGGAGSPRDRGGMGHWSAWLSMRASSIAWSDTVFAITAGCPQCRGRPAGFGELTRMSSRKLPPCAPRYVFSPSRPSGPLCALSNPTAFILVQASAAHAVLAAPDAKLQFKSPATMTSSPFPIAVLLTWHTYSTTFWAISAALSPHTGM